MVDSGTSAPDHPVFREEMVSIYNLAQPGGTLSTRTEPAAPTASCEVLTAPRLHVRTEAGCAEDTLAGCMAPTGDLPTLLADEALGFLGAACCALALRPLPSSHAQLGPGHVW